MSKKGNPSASWKNAPTPSKTVKVAENPESTINQTLAWQFYKRDRDHAKWGWDKLTHEDLIELIDGHLASFETMTWAEILRATGGRNNGNNSHSVLVEKCCKEAKARLTELKSDDIDELFSLRLTGKCRLWGIRDGRVLRFIWHDPDHTIYPV